MNDALANPVREQPFTVAAADGPLLRGTRFGEPASGRSLVIASALGVPRKLYAAFAAHAAGRGCCVYTFDYRGIGDSAAGVRGRDLQMADWGRDIDAVLRHAAAEVPGPRGYLGHSCGAQLCGLAEGFEGVDAAVFVAPSAPRPGLYPWPDRAVLWLLWSLLMPLLARGRDELPRRFAPGGGQFPSGVSRQWAAWARSPHYLFDPRHGIDTSRYARLQLPILSLGFADDRYAPAAARDALLQRFAGARIERREAGGRLGHFGFFRPTLAQPLWAPTLDWLLDRLG